MDAAIERHSPNPESAERTTPTHRLSSLEEKAFDLTFKTAAARVALEIIHTVATDVLEPDPKASRDYQELRQRIALQIIQERASWMLRELKHPNAEGSPS